MLLEVGLCREDLLLEQETACVLTCCVVTASSDLNLNEKHSSAVSHGRIAL